MPLPTREQIVDTVVLPHYKVELESGTSFYEVLEGDVFEITGDYRSTGSTVNGLSFGTYTEPSAQVTLYKRGTIAGHAGVVRSYDDTYWINKKIRISQAFDTSDYVPLFVGVIRDYDVDEDSVTLRSVGVLEYVRNTKLYTGATKNRPIATRTGLGTEEDPTEPGYVAGTINRIFWEAGGRPLEQYTDPAFADAAFWYSCEQSIFTPQYSWFSGENLVEELFLLARSSGGQIYQTVELASEGGVPVIRYVQPLTLADTSDYVSFFDYSGDMYTGFGKSLSGVEKASTVRCNFAQRREYVMQEIFNDTTARTIRPGETKEYDFETQLPVFIYETITSQNFRISFNHNSRIIEIPFTVIHQTATRITIEFENDQSYPVTINEIKIKGIPLAIEEEGLVTYGSGTPVIDIEDSPYIQSYGHALRLSRMVYDFFSTYRPIVTLTGCPYDPDRFLGEIVQCNNNDTLYWNSLTEEWVEDTGYYRIIGIKHSNTGASMDIMLVPIAGIPDRNDMYIVGEEYTSGDVRLLSY